MKNNIFYTFFIIFAFLNLNLIAKELEINSIKIKYDNIDKVTIFEGSVDVQDEEGNKIFSEYVEYNKLSELIVTKGETKIITSNGYEILGSDISLDNKKKIIRSSYKTKVTDKEGNKIFVDMFDYSTLTNIFFSKGNIKVLDINNNNYNFSQIYIDENKKKIIGTDVKAFLNQGFIASNKNNEPRIFANTMSISENISTLEKGVVTYCKTRQNEKCPPWTLQSNKIKHDLAKKTIYYDNVVLKIYDFPIFFSPKFSHPDPSVKRRSGLLAPLLTNSSTLGTGFGVPYFWNISNDRDLTFTPKIYLDEKPLILAAYRQKFEKSSLLVDAGYTQGYKKKNIKKTSGSRSHFFSNFKMNLFDSENKSSDLERNLEKFLPPFYNFYVRLSIH
jgi:LPS-assembly protein